MPDFSPCISTSSHIPALVWKQTDEIKDLEVQTNALFQQLIKMPLLCLHVITRSLTEKDALYRGHPYLRIEWSHVLIKI